MKTQFKKDGNTVIISMDGKLNYEIQEPLRKSLKKIVSDAKTETKNNTNTDEAATHIIFDMENLQFVGSSGISNFIQTLKDIGTQTDSKPRYANVRSEFQKVMKALDNTNQFEFYENVERAKKSFNQ